MTWEEIRDHLRGRYQLKVDEEDRIDLAWSFEAFPGAPVQLQRVRHIRGGEREPHLGIYCPVATEAQLAPRAALAHNATLAVGALALEDILVVLRYTVPVRRLSVRALDQALWSIAHEAARLRQTYAGSPGGD